MLGKACVEHVGEHKFSKSDYYSLSLALSQQQQSIGQSCSFMALCCYSHAKHNQVDNFLTLDAARRAIIMSKCDIISSKLGNGSGDFKVQCWVLLSCFDRNITYLHKVRSLFCVRSIFVDVSRAPDTAAVSSLWFNIESGKLFAFVLHNRELEAFFLKL